MKAILKYPVFVFVENDNMVYVYYNDRQMKTTNTEIFRTTNFKGDVIIDSAKNKYITKSAYITKYLWYKFWMKGTVVEFEDEYEDEVTSITLDELKEMIMERYPRSRWFHSGWADVKEFKEEMDKCRSFEEVALLFRPVPSKNAWLRFWRGY